MSNPNPNPVLQNAGLAKARAAKAAKREAKLAEAAPTPPDPGPAAPAAEEAPVRRTRARLAEPTTTQAAAPTAPGRAAARSVEAVGRNGEVLSRKRTASGDIFDVPKALIPKGWEYQWCAVSVIGNTEILLDQNLMFAENGWRPVPASRYPGRYMPAGHTGSIIRGSQMLMERPEVLCIDARNEDVRAAKQLISDRNESLKLSGVRKQMADGFEMSGKYRGTGGDIRMSIDPALDVPRPQRQLADGDK